MTSRILAASLLAAFAVPATAQNDRVTLMNGTVHAEVRVTAFDIRSIKFTKGSANESFPTDQVAKVELAKFLDVCRRGLKDADVMVTLAREQLKEKNLLIAQFAFVSAAAQFFDDNKAQEAVGALEEMQTAIPEAGLLPEVYRMKFEYYIGLGSKGVNSASTVAKKYQADAIAGAWPPGFGTEAEFFMALADRKDPKDFQAKLKALVTKAGGGNPMIANRANIQLANSLHETKDVEGAKRIYEEISAKEKVDDSSRAGAYLGLGKLVMEQASANDKDGFKKALLLFLKVRLETKESWPSLQAEALYHAMLAADKWRGPEYNLVMARCRNTLASDFSGTEWAEKARR
ncbi:MAG: hypothetical protein WAT39_05660 [Planctomycetota bacterium]